MVVLLGSLFSSSSYLNNPKLSGGGILLEWGVHAISQLVHIFENSKIENSSNVIFQDLIDVHNKARLIFKNEKRNTSELQDLND